MSEKGKGEISAAKNRMSHLLNVSSYRFRHAYAINFLRNGSNVYALQSLLGHTALDMCKRYLALGNIDMNAVLAQASPVANWNL